MREVNPMWTKYLLGFIGSGMVLLLAWVLLSVHNQESVLKDGMNEIKITSLKTSAALTVEFKVLSNEFSNIKETFKSRRADRYTGTQARDRSKLMDERCASIKKELEEIKDEMDNYHNNL